MRRFILAAVTFLVCSVYGFTQAPAVPNELFDAIGVLRPTLNDAQRAKLFMPFNSDERLNWQFVPKERSGLPLADLDDVQKEKCLAILRVMVSAEGYKTVETIRSLEEVLLAMKDNPGMRNPQKYYTSIFGEPSNETPWSLRFEGHHLSLNWTFAGGKIVSSTVQFLGSNPGETMEGPKKGTRPLAAEEDLARKLVKSLDEAHLKSALIGTEAPHDIVTGTQREVAILDDLGVAYKDLNAEQQGLLISILDVYASMQRPEVAQERMARLKTAGLDAIKFGWMGSLERGQGHYYRIQGPTFLVEYDNTQNNANHVHAVWRDFKGDFGADVLKEHYKQQADARHPAEHEHN